MFFDDTNASMFLLKQDILAKVSEEDIFGIVFNPYPGENVKILSPFRIDNNPGCFIERSKSGNLYFYDYADNPVSRDCFQCVMDIYGLNFKEAMTLIYQTLIEGKKVVNNINKKEIVKKKKTETVFKIEERAFNCIDNAFWSKFGITEKQLTNDGVHAINRYSINNNGFVKPSTICYCYTDFDTKHCKIYKPFSKNNRFLGNCTSDDIGSVKFLKEHKGTLFITKSYKDCRVLRNIFLNSVWLQNEGCQPSFDKLRQVTEGFEKVIVFFDNDRTGLEKVIKLSEHIGCVHNNTLPFTLPSYMYENGIKDPADLVNAKGQYELIKTLKNANLI